MSYMFRIDIDPGMVSGGNKANFPVLIDSRITSLPSGFWSSVTDPNGLDIRFYSDAAKTVEYKREIVHFNTSPDQFEAWVQIPTLYGTASTVLFCEVGAGNIANDNSLWSDVGVESVYHLQANGNDSLGNKNGTVYGPTNGTGKIGNGYNFDGINDYIEMDNRDLLNTTPYYCSAWVRLEDGRDGGTWDENVSVIYNRTRKCEFTGRQWAIWNFGISEEIKPIWYLADISSNNCALAGYRVDRYTANNGLTQGVWYHLAVVVENITLTSPNRVVKFYVNGQLVASTEDSLTSQADYLNAHKVTQKTRIGGAFKDGGGDFQNFDGDIDDVKFANNAIYNDATWIETEYNNQNDPDSYITASTILSTTYFINAAGLNTYPFDTKTKGATTFSNLINSVSLTNDDIVEVCDDALIDDSASLNLYIDSVNVTIRSHSGNVGKPLVKAPQTSGFLHFRGGLETITGISVENIRFYKEGGLIDGSFLSFTYIASDEPNFNSVYIAGNEFYGVDGSVNNTIDAIVGNHSRIGSMSIIQNNEFHDVGNSIYIGPRIDGLTIEDNKFYDSGTGIVIQNESNVDNFVIYENEFYNLTTLGVFLIGANYNQVQITQNLLYNLGSMGGIIVGGGASTFNNSAIIQNSLSNIGGIAIDVNGVSMNSVNILNNVIDGNGVTTDGMRLNSYNSGTLDYNCIWNCFTLLSIGGTVSHGPNLIALDPLFTSPTDLHLQESSPCIQQGVGWGVYPQVPSAGFDGNPRGTTTCDMGAYELVLVLDPIPFNIIYRLKRAGRLDKPDNSLQSWLIASTGHFDAQAQSDGTITDHIARAQALLIEQFEQSDKLKTLLGIYVKQLQEIEYVISNLGYTRNKNVATGAQLDIIGERVGESRQFRNDDDYRAAINARIFLNSSNGEPETVIEAIRIICNANRVWYSEIQPATIILQYRSDLLPPSNLQTQIEQIALAGVQILISYVNSSDPIFGFDGEGPLSPNDGSAGFSEEGYAPGGTELGGRFMELIT